MYGLYFQPFDPPPPVKQFAHPCRGRTKCDACIKFALLEDQKKETPSITEDEKFATEYIETLTAMNENHDPLLRKLPEEIIGQIFEVCGPFNDEQDCRLRTGAICRSWRRISWATPGIWSRIIVVLAAPEEQHQAALVEEWLERSGDLPLEVFVREQFPLRSFLVTPSDYYVNALAKVLNRFSDRWAHLYIDAPKRFYNLFTGNDKGASRLHSLTLTLEPWQWDRPETAGQFQISASLPAPRNVDLLLIAPSSVKITWCHVVSVSLALRNPDDALSIFELAPQMKTLTFDLILSDSDPDIAFQPRKPKITHGQLEEFTIESPARKRNMDLFMDSLILPVLQKLTLTRFSSFSRESNGRGIPFSAIHALIVRSSCVLKELCLLYSDYHTAELLSFLSTPRLASLEQLDLSVYFMYWKDPLRGELFKVLAKTCNDDTPFLPKLRSLSFRLTSNHQAGPAVYPQDQFPWEHIIGMFGTQNHPSSRPLTRLMLSCENGLGIGSPSREHGSDVLPLEIARSLVHLQMKPGMQLEVHDSRGNDILKEHYHQMFGICEPPKYVPGWTML